ncbi:FhaA domain-containing protein [Propioniciclava sinopodophylli]|uniref:FhaA domain-containing protein n=1 Tax=Propioniciclava sinopodophylli TaxID=1837344 RepID=UPI00249333C8|nr:FhaA domain-containing protein [Propioniciclava sinopodophylli]
MTTTIYFILMIIAIVAVCVWALRGHRGATVRISKPSGASRGPMPLPSVKGLFSGRTLTPKHIQARARSAIISAVRTETLYSETLSLPRVTVALSPEAFQVIQPVQRRLAQELENHLPAEAAQDGFTVDGNLSVTFHADPQLSGDMVRALPEDVPEEQLREDPLRIPPTTTPSNGQRVTRPLAAGTQPAPAASAQLWVVGGGRGPALALEAGHEYTIGASGATDLRFDRPDISGVHASVRLCLDAKTGKPMVLIRDIDSTNGTTVDGQKVDKKGAPVRHGGVITLAASTQLRVTIAQTYSRVTGYMEAGA